jgi:hypothetical protein
LLCWDLNHECDDVNITSKAGPLESNFKGVGAGGKMTQALYAHMNNKIIKKRDKKRKIILSSRQTSS